MASGWSGSGSSCDCVSAGVVAEGQEVRGGGGTGTGTGTRRRLVQEDSALDGFAADGALAHSVPAQLAGAVAAHEDHVLQPVQTHGTHGLQGGDGEQRSAGGHRHGRMAARKDLTCSLMSWSCCWSFCTSAFTFVLSLSLCKAGMFPLAALARQQKKCAGRGGRGDSHSVTSLKKILTVSPVATSNLTSS